MSSRNASSEIVALLILSGVAVAVAWHVAFSGAMTFAKLSGFLAGLLGGNLAVIMQMLGRRPGGANRVFRSLFLLLSPLGCLVVFLFSAHAGTGYCLGASVTSCSAWALLRIAGAKPRP
jgi:hypothetical protein